MKIFLMGALFFTWGPGTFFAQENYKEIIVDPSITTACKSLMSLREQKISLKQRSSSLIRRTEKLIKIVPKRRKSVALKLDIILNQLHQEKAILDLQISHMEENIVRKGCPGITL